MERRESRVYSTHMGNTSKKHRNKKLAKIGLIVLAVLLVGSFIVSQVSKKKEETPLVRDDVQIFPLEARVKGDTAAILNLVEYSDFQCPYCSQAAQAVQELTDAYGNQFSFEFRHFPLRTIHPNAQIAAQAAEAAGVQGKFWEMHDILFARQQEWSTSINPKKQFKVYAEEIAINSDRFLYDLESDEVKAKVNAGYDQAMALGLQGTPTFLVNGQQSTLEAFLSELDLERVQALDVSPKEEVDGNVVTPRFTE